MTAKQKFKKETVAKALYKAGTILGAAQILKCDRQTVYNYLKRYPELEEAVYEAKERLCDIAEAGLASNIHSKHPASIFFFLKTFGKNRGYVERQEVTGKDGENLFKQAADEFEHSIAQKLKAATATKVPKKPKRGRKSKS